MGDMGIMFRIMKDESKDRRTSHRNTSPQCLRDAGISFERINGGVQLIVESDHGLIDFWPGTGRWRVRAYATTKFGVKNLIKFIRSHDASKN